MSKQRISDDWIGICAGIIAWVFLIDGFFVFAVWLKSTGFPQGGF